MALFWQRQFTFVSVLILSAAYYSVWVSVVCYIIVMVTEAIEYCIARRVISGKEMSGRETRRHLVLLMFSAVLSTSVIAIFVVVISSIEGQTTHFAPLFFLLSAALFAAMNNHQMMNILVMRLVIYGLAFLFIPIRDLWIVRPPWDHALWLQMATAVFILYFVVDCSRIFIELYQKNLDKVLQLEDEHRRVTEAYKLQSEFVSVVSHELRTPLTSINGALGLLNSGALADKPDKIAQLVKVAHQNGLRLGALVNDLLDLQKLSAGKMTYHMVALDVPTLVVDAVEATKSMADAAGIHLAVMPTEDRMTVRGDRTRLLQVLQNVLSNAVKFSSRGGDVTIRLREAKGRALISIVDRGRGIPDGAESLVFGRFTQVDATDVREVGGTGLGMSITREILAAHNGRIYYDSRLGEGTTFTIELDLT